MTDQKRERPRAKKPQKPGGATRLATGDEPSVYTPHEPEPLDYDDGPSVMANPYAPTGWGAKNRIEFDIRLPDKVDEQGNLIARGQLCQLTRLERDDLFRLNLHEKLDTFTPLLMGDAMTEEERQQAMRDKMQEDPEALTKMFDAIDIVVMAATLKPRITNDPTKVNIGTPADWANPNFVATVPIDNISLMDRMFIFGSAFGRSMDDLKSLWQQAEGLGGLENQPNVQSVAQ